MTLEEPCSSDSGSTNKPLHSSDPLTPTTHAKPSPFYARVSTTGSLTDRLARLTYTALFVLHAPLWLLAMVSVKLCGRPDPLSEVHVRRAPLLLLLWKTLFLCKNAYLFNISSGPIRPAYPYRGFPFDSQPIWKVLLIAGITIAAPVAESFKLLPTGASLVSGDVMISALLWQRPNSDRPFTRASRSTLAELHAILSTRLSQQWDEARKRQSIPLAYRVSTESEKHKAPTRTANPSNPPTGTGDEVPPAARHDPTDSNAVKYASILLRSFHVESNMKTMFHAGLSGFLLVEEELRRMLRDLGRNLAVEGGAGLLAGAAEMLQSEEGSNDTAREMLELALDLQSGGTDRPLVSRSKQASEGQKWSSEEQSDRGELAAVAGFTVKDDAQLAFEWDLLHCAHSSYENRLRSILAGATLLGQSGADLSPSKSMSVIKELSWTPRYLADIVEHKSFSRSDKVKTFVESQMGETWNWWPLGPASRQLRAGHHRLQWKSVCAPDIILYNCCLR